MDLLQLQYFRTIAQYENITKAAQALFVSQPNLSTSLSRLEDDLEVKLFDRRRGKVSLTPNGQLFLSYVERVLDELDAGIEKVRAAEHADHNQIRVVGSQMDFISHVLLECYPKDQKIRIKQVRCANLDVFDRVLSDDADFGFYFGEPKTRILEYIPMLTAERVAIIHRDHPLAERERISIAELANEPFICNYCRDDVEFLEELVEYGGFRPHVFFECDDTRMEATLVATGRGVSISPLPNYHKFLQQNPNLPIAFLRFEEALPLAKMGTVRRPGNRLTDSALYFLQCVNDFFKRDYMNGMKYIQTYGHRNMHISD